MNTRAMISPLLNKNSRESVHDAPASGPQRWRSTKARLGRYTSSGEERRARHPRTPFRDNDPIGGPRKDYFLNGRRSSQLAGRLIKHARYYWLMLAKSHLTRRLFGSMIRRIDALAAATG